MKKSLQKGTEREWEGKRRSGNVERKGVEGKNEKRISEKWKYW